MRNPSPSHVFRGLNLFFFYPALPQKQNRRRVFTLRRSMISTRSKRSGRFGHIRRLGAFRSLHDLELDRVSFLQRSVAIPEYRRVMYEHIGPVFPPDESIPLRIIEPFHSSLHFVSPW